MNDPQTFIVKVTDAQGRDLFNGSFQAATYHRALRIAWSETTDDLPVRSAVAPEPAPMPVARPAAMPVAAEFPIPAPVLAPEHGLLRVR
jgi:hypothetical protein